MATWDDVDRAALALPATHRDTTYDKRRCWKVDDKLIAWDRPLGHKDRADLGDAAWGGDILAVRVADLDAKEELLITDPDVYFTIPHFTGYPAVLIRLERLVVDELHGLLADAWRHRARKTLIKQHPEI